MQHKMHEDIAKVLISRESLRSKVKELGEQIAQDYQDKEVIAVAILKGSVVFFADLIRAIDMPVQLDFMSISSYGNSRSSSGVVQIRKDLDINISGKHVLIIEDIMDSGQTLYYLMDMLSAREPASLKVCCLLDKPERRVADISRLLRLCHPRRVRGGLWPGLCRKIPEFGLCRRFEQLRLRERKRINGKMRFPAVKIGIYGLFTCAAAAAGGKIKTGFALLAAHMHQEDTRI